MLRVLTLLALAKAPEVTTCSARSEGQRATAAPWAPRKSRWVSKATLVRGGSDAEQPSVDEETTSGTQESGILSPLQLAISSFNDIVGESLLVVDDPKKGTFKEVGIFLS